MNTLLVLLILIAALSIFSIAHFLRAYSKFKTIPVRSRMTGHELAQLILRNNDLDDYSVAITSGRFADHFNYRNKTVYLSDEIYNGISVTAIAVAAHETAHAVQYRKAWLSPYREHRRLNPVKHYAFAISEYSIYVILPLLLYGFIFVQEAVVTAGIITYCAALIVNIFRIRHEYLANFHVLKEIELSRNFNQEEIDSIKALLNAALATYLAGSITSVLGVFTTIIRRDK
ncbi:zinc metallopeptidase [candidate division KSB1 bacterium]